MHTTPNDNEIARAFTIKNTLEKIKKKPQLLNCIATIDINLYLS